MRASDGGRGIASTFLNSRATWHKTCRYCFNTKHKAGETREKKSGV